MQETERFVRDLVWAVNSPSLMNLTSQESVPARPLKVSDIDGEHLSVHLTSPREQRVGRYFERLLIYWIRFLRRCEIVAHSMQLRDGKRTVGEIDLLFRDEKGRLNHWEVACKFYLQVDAGHLAASDYVGPNATDTLRKKATRLLEHQLPLGVRYFPDIELREAFVKGRIFYHWQTGSKDSSPIELATDHLEGQWLRAREVPELLRSSRRRYRILRKPFWLADEIADPSDDEILTDDETTQVLQDHFSSHHSPRLLSGFRDSTSPVRESERWFVVPNHWPRQDERIDV
ncbi:DUF1853 family protein [Allorhodopirellula solitaria]|uniref:DUF1853 domain-containing protein n=1 Tax=Allorhodopirellula solitaria TaxID=2527987 RepID=A0A5C5YG29_9BACT|nr:DUF1853 family protein [Allorhodopirellula solitaria]TWT74300.1 hypothetical protein CA85_11870 [Allorhodopirellula solitaria]